MPYRLAKALNAGYFLAYQLTVDPYKFAVRIPSFYFIFMSVRLTHGR